MLDIKFIREYTDAVRQNLYKRGDEAIIGLLAQIEVEDENWRKQRQEVDKLKAERNKMASEIGEAKKAGEEVPGKIAQMQNLKDEIEIKLN